MYISSKEDIKNLTQSLFDQFNIKKAAVFGSFARNENKDQSDIDILIEFQGYYDFLTIIDLQQQLEDILGRKVDLITYKSLLDKEFDKTILNEAQTIYEKK